MSQATTPPVHCPDCGQQLHGPDGCTSDDEALYLCIYCAEYVEAEP